MNAQAASQSKRLLRAVQTGKLDGKVIRCGCYDHAKQEDCRRKATYIKPYYDIFSDDPKGLVTACDRHEDECESEGYFTCCACERLFVSNYTWELYNKGDLCLNCYRERELAKPERWIELSPANIAAVTPEQVRKAPHLFAVGQNGTYRKPDVGGVRFIDNVEFDNTDGHQISGGDIKHILTDAHTQGYRRAVLILDACYQFSVSCGVYVDPQSKQV
jgi:hypothetical protein